MKNITHKYKEEKFLSCKGKGYVILDFGQELCGGIRMVTRAVDGVARFRLTFGESLTECLSNIGEKNATNDHSPRDFEAIVPAMSDLTFGQTGFRFIRIELLSNNPVLVKNIFAINHKKRGKLFGNPLM